MQRDDGEREDEPVLEELLIIPGLSASSPQPEEAKPAAEPACAPQPLSAADQRLCDIGGRLVLLFVAVLGVGSVALMIFLAWKYLRHLWNA